MPAGMIFWMLMILWFIGLVAVGYGRRAETWIPYFVGGGIVLFILMFLLGWKTFGFVVQ